MTTVTDAQANGKVPGPMSLGDPSSASHPRLLPLSSLLDDFADDAADRHQAHQTGALRGPVSGLASLDKALGGVLEPGLHVLHAGPGVGKTALGLQIAGSCGFPALVVSAEMRPLELLRRIIARTTGTYLGRLKSGEFAPEDALKKAREAVALVPQLAIVDATDAYADPDWLRDAARIVQADAKHVLLVIDSVHSWSGAATGGQTEYDRLADALGALRSLAGALGCPILAIAERNRVSMKDGGMNAAAGTRGFEYGAESVLSLDVDDKGQAPSVDEKVIRLELAKNRNGPAHKGLKLAFHGALQRFSDVENGR